MPPRFTFALSCPPDAPHQDPGASVRTSPTSPPSDHADPNPSATPVDAPPDPLDRFVTLLQQLAPCDASIDADPPIDPSVDLCTLALLAASDDLHADPEGACVCPRSQARLNDLAGVRPERYWGVLLGAAQTLKLMRPEDGRWRVLNHDAEMFGATATECFPGMMAAWCSDHAWQDRALEGVGLDGACRPAVALDLVRTLGALTEGRWYPVALLDAMVALVSDRHGLGVSAIPEGTGLRLAQRALLMMGACDLNRAQTHVRRRHGLALPPLPADIASAVRAHRPASAKPCSRAEAYSAIIARKLQRKTSWEHVSKELACYRERRRDREPSDHCLTLLDQAGLVQADATTPFRDCLRLVRLGTLVPTSDRGPTGRFWVRLRPDAIPHDPQAPALDTLSHFLSQRGCCAAPEQARAMLLRCAATLSPRQPQ